MNTLMHWMKATATVSTLAIAALGSMAGCSDPAGTDGENNGNNSGVCASEGAKLTVSLENPDPATGFAPLSVNFTGNVSLIENVDYNWTFEFGDAGTASGVNSRPNATHEYTEAGVYEVRLIVNDETCGTRAIVQSDVEVFAPVELAGSDLTARPGNVTVGENIQVNLDVKNEAEESPLTLPVTVSFFLSPRPGVLWDEVPALLPLTNVTLMPNESGVTIEAGGTATISEEVTIPEAVLTDSYHVIAAIDLNNEVGENDDERNNLVSSDAPVFIENVFLDSPDLLTENVQVGPTTAFRTLSALSLNVDIKNIGTRFADTGYAVYIVEGPVDLPAEAEPVFVSDEFPVDFQPPNNIFQVRAQQIVLANPIELPDGADELEVFVYVCVDHEEGVPEDNEDNNCARSENGVLISNTALDGVDIVLVDFELNPNSTFLDGTVEVTLEVTNFGTQPTRSFFCAIFLSEDENLDVTDERLTNINFSNLAPDDTQRVSRISSVPGFLPVGVFNVFAFCDPSDVVRETFEDNNIRRLEDPLTITAEAIIDLVINEVTLSPSELEDGGTLTVNMNVANTGTSGAGPATINIRRSLDESCTPDDLLLGTVPAPPLGPESEADVELIVNELLCDIFQDSYTICVQFDPTNSVPEIDESNNLLVLEDPLTFIGERCACENDPFEPNETPQTAVPLVGGTYEGNTICQNRGKDYYGVDLSVGQSLSVRASLSHTGDCSNLDLQILDPNFQPIPDAISRTDGQLEQADLFLVQRQGRYLIRVEGRTDCDVNRYDLEVNINSPGPGVDLTGTDLVVDDTNPALGQEVVVDFRTLNIADDDAGDYDITLYLTEDLEIDIIDFELDTVTIEGGLQGARARDDQLTIEIPVDAINGAYFVCAVLDANDDLTENDENNNIVCSEQIEVDTECYDPFEVNDTPEDATDVEPGAFENLNVCDQGRLDHYRFCVDDGSRVEARLDFTHANGDIDIRLLRDSPGFPEVAHSTGVRDFEEIVIDFVTGDQCYILQVLLNDREQTSNDYAMDISVEPADPILRCDSIFEPNNTPDDAIASGSDLVVALNDELTLDRCPQNDFDFFYVDLVAGPTITLCADNHESNPQPFNLNVALFDPSQRQLIAQTGPNPCIERRLDVTGRYFVRVLSVNPDQRAVRYTLSLEGLFGVDLVGRDLSVDPTDLVPGDGNIIVYNFTIENARTDRAEDINYGIYYSTDALIDPIEDFLIATRNISDLDGFTERNILGTVVLPDDGPYQPGEGYIGVFIDPDDEIEEENNNNNRLQTLVNLLVCGEDAFDGNQSLETAAIININDNNTDLTICPETVDWFCLDDLTAGNYAASATFALDPENLIESDLNIEVHRVDDNFTSLEILGSDIEIQDNASVAFNLTETSNVCVRVAPLRTTGTNTYSLSVSQP